MFLFLHESSFLKVRDVAYKLYFGMANVKVSRLNIMLAIFQKGVRDITLAHRQQAVHRLFHALNAWESISTNARLV